MWCPLPREHLVLGDRGWGRLLLELASLHEGLSMEHMVHWHGDDCMSESESPPCVRLDYVEHDISIYIN